MMREASFPRATALFQRKVSNDREALTTTQSTTRAPWDALSTRTVMEASKRAINRLLGPAAVA